MTEASRSTNTPGTVCTFYSYKGGVGRSMALANVGVLMANQGHRVLLVDWDIEAPGLEIFFRNAARLIGDPREVPGVLDLIEGHAGGTLLDWRKCLLKAEFFGQALDIISAGKHTSDYRHRVQQLNWDVLFREHHIGNYISQLRDDWRAAYDFVLIDSRTGITDVGDICTVLLPDILVLLFVSNHQNVEGIKNTMARAVKARGKLPVNRSKLLGVPIPARDERDREYEKSIEWQRIYAAEFGELYREWLPVQINPADALNKLYIPYVAAWSFGERIPVIESERERSDPSSLGAAYGRLAALLSNRLDWQAIDAGASTAELIGSRLELSKEREARAAAERSAEQTRYRARRWIVGLAAVLLVSVIGGIGWYQIRPEPIPTEAVVAYRAALLEYTRERVPLDWARTQNNLGVALQTLGERESGTALLDEAVAAYRAALLEYTRERVPLNWAGTQNNLGLALGTLGERESGTARLDEAVAAYRAALLERTRERVPLEWARTQNNLGNVLRTLGTRRHDAAPLCAALEHHLAALEVFAADSPHDVNMARAGVAADLEALKTKFDFSDYAACLARHQTRIERLRGQTLQQLPTR